MSALSSLKKSSPAAMRSKRVLTLERSIFLDPLHEC
jgi:hypothetical protein